MLNLEEKAHRANKQMANKSYRLKLFESFRSNFRLSALVTFTKRNRGDAGGGESNLIYSSKGYATFNPGTFLELTYLSSERQSDNKSVYITYQHLPKLVSIFDTVIENAYDPKGDLWTNVGNSRQVSPQYSNPYVIDNIGHKSNYIRISMITCIDDHGMVSSKPGISIALPDCVGCILTLDEAEAIDEVLHELRLPDLAMTACSTEMLLREIESANGIQDDQAASNQYNAGGSNYQQAYSNRWQSNGGQQQSAYRPQPSSYQNYQRQPQPAQQQAPAAQPQQAAPKAEEALARPVYKPSAPVPRRRHPELSQRRIKTGPGQRSGPVVASSA
jgi:hypothetical protein